MKAAMAALAIVVGGCTSLPDCDKPYSRTIPHCARPTQRNADLIEICETKVITRECRLVERHELYTIIRQMPRQ